MATKTTTSKTTSTPKAATTPKAAATAKVEGVRTAVLERLQQGQEAAVVAAERFGQTIERVVPAPVMPLLVTVQRAVVTNVEFAANLARHQADFATKVAKALLPAA